MNLQHKPVSAALLRSLRGEMSQHPVLVWLDRDDHYSPFVDALASADAEEGLPGPVLRHRGSYLELMIELDQHASGVDASPLLVHLPGANEDTVHAGPLLELYMAGFRFRKALRTAVQDAAVGRIPPDEIEAFLEEQGTEGLTLEAADTWMAAKVSHASSELEAQLQGIKLYPLIDDLLTGGPIAVKLEESVNYGLVWNALAARFGVPSSWQEELRDLSRLEAADVAAVAASWAMCVEFVHDLKRSPKAPPLVGLETLDKSLAKLCAEAATALRSGHPEFYEQLDRDLSDMIEAERAEGVPDELGKVDTFKFEEERLYVAALHALATNQPGQALQWAKDRLGGASFWLERDPDRKVAWRLVLAAGELGVAVGEAALSFAACASLGEAAGRYAEQGAPVDRLHRQLGQIREPHLHRKRMPHFEDLRRALNAVEAAWASWAEALAQEWTTLCEREGFLPDSQLQQRRIFDDAVVPLLDDSEKTVYFIVDALRYEMAQELVALIGSPARTAVNLTPRLAELPSVTEVGMNLLAPALVGGKLTPVLDNKARRFKGFKAAQFQITGVDARKKAIRARAGGSACPWHEIEDLLAMGPAEIKKSLQNARMGVVHSIRIDKSGESGAGFSVFGSELDRLRKAWKLLRDAGVRRFVFTADHGFLLRRPSSETGEEIVEHGGHHDALPRYALYKQNTPNTKQTGVSFAALQYQGEEMNLLFPRGIGVHKLGAARNYVHGGNSPQERIIPVLTIRHKQPPGDHEQRYVVKIGEVDTTSGGIHRLRAKVEPIVGILESSLFPANETTLALEVVGYPAVQHVVVDTGGAASLQGRRILVQVGQDFEVFFRLSGPEHKRVQVRIFHPDGNHQVDPGVPVERFDVEVDPRRKPQREPIVEPGAETEGAAAQAPTAPASPQAVEEDWLSGYEDAGQRRVFEHIHLHGLITESEATAMLGGPRKWRRFVNRFETLKARAPFDVRIDMVNGEKRYTKS